jgi:DNA-binding NarL/FixJ family response regulator
MSPPSNVACKAEILIVDDQAPMRDAIRLCIVRSFPKVRVIEAPDGAAAVEHVKAYRPALVLMDINLPDANGLELTRNIRKLCPPTVVAAISIDASKHIPAQALAAGAAAFISKDRLFDELGTLIGAVMTLRSWM